jgi:nitronate monooxygenase
MLPPRWRERLRVPAIAAPMTDVSGPELVAAACASGVMGTFPTHNAADTRELERWLDQIAGDVLVRTPTGRQAAPVGANLVVHRSNARLADDLRAVIRGGVEVVVASVGSPKAIVGPLHDAGIVVLADVASLRHVDRAVASGVDGVVLLTAGAGGQTGWANPFAFLRAVRQRYDGVVVLAGGVSDGAGILAAQVLGADLAYLGTRFIATTESYASPAYREAVIAATLDDVTASSQVSGLVANVLTDWLQGIDVGATEPVSDGFSVDRLLAHRGVWAAGHSVSGADEVLDVAELVDRLEYELEQARRRLFPSGVAAAECWRS